MRSSALCLLVGIVAIFSGCYVLPVEEVKVVEPAPQPVWEPITLSAKGGGAPPAKAVNAAQARLMTERAATMDAYRNLLEQAYGVNISARSTVRNFILKNDTLKSRVEAYIRGARVVDTIYHEDGGVEVEMEITLGPDFRDMFPR